MTALSGRVDPFRFAARALGVGWCAASLCLPVLAQGAGATDSRIALVTLYPGSATVERVARVAAGAKRFVFNCLPAALDVQSLALSADALVRLGELAVLNEEREAVPACAGTPLDARIRELEDRKGGLTAENDALTIVTGYLKGVSTPDAAASGPRLASDARSIAPVADALRRSAQEALTRQQQITRLQEELDRTLKPLLAERQRMLAGRARVLSVSVTLEAPREAELRLSYQVNGPGWQPVYRAWLDTRSQVLRLERQAQVAQATGEDWQGVGMRLSTGQPRRGTTAPTPNPWRIGIAEPQLEQAARKSFAMAAPAPMAATASRSLMSGGVSVADSFDVSVFNNAFATEFSVPQRIDVPSGGQRVTLQLGALDAPVTLLTRSTPQVDPSAWLVAELPQPEGVWPSGALQLYRDGAYVGSDQLHAAVKGPLSLPFGRDELVSVRVEPQKDLRGSTGFVGSRAERSVERAYTVENRHRTPLSLQVLEASPVSIDEKVSVENRFDPKPQTIAWDEQPGVVLWSMTLEPGKTARFTAAYSIAYPKDARLQENR